MITLSAQLWAFPGHENDLISYEDDVLALLGDHGAVVLSRVRAAEPGDGPTEVLAFLV